LVGWLLLAGLSNQQLSASLLQWQGQTPFRRWSTSSGGGSNHSSWQAVQLVCTKGRAQQHGMIQGPRWLLPPAQAPVLVLVQHPHPQQHHGMQLLPQQQQQRRPVWLRAQRWWPGRVLLLLLLLLQNRVAARCGLMTQRTRTVRRGADTRLWGRNKNMLWQ
jgi:hypothetical protein